MRQINEQELNEILEIELPNCRFLLPEELEAVAAGMGPATLQFAYDRSLS